jgi:hypothetical protein
MQDTDLPTLAEQIAWLRERAADADLLRQHLVGTGSVNPLRASRDAGMWNAVLMSLEALAENEVSPNSATNCARLSTSEINHLFDRHFS